MSTTERIYNDGGIIIKEGDIGNSFFKLLEGHAGVYVNYGQEDQIKLTVLDAGQYFGEMAVIETYPRSTTIVAEGSVRAVEIPESALNTYFSEDPGLIIELMKHLGTRLRSLSAEYEDAKSVLANLKNSGKDDKNESFIAKIMKHLSRYNPDKADISEPSIESVRELSKDISRDDSGSIMKFRKGSIIFKKGEVGNCMYILHGGSVGIYNNYGEEGELKLTELLPVSYFGEMGMLAGEPRSATAIVDSDETYVEIVRPEDLADMFKTSPVKVDMILRHLSYRLRSLTNDYFKTCKEISESYSQ